MKKVISLILALVLTLSLTFVVACGEAEDETSSTPLYQEDTELGKGKNTFTLEVVWEKSKVNFTIHTDKTIVGEALLELGLIEGKEEDYGLYVKKVNGILADYDIDSTYWAFYINGEYATTGVDGTKIVNGATYKLSREK